VHRDLKSRTLKTPSDDSRLATHSLDRGTEFGPHMRQAEAAHVAGLDPLEVGPEVFAWIQLRGLGREALQVEARGCPMGQKRSADVAAVHGGTIPEHDYPAGDFAPQVL
jgi:hypothetical protein